MKSQCHLILQNVSVFEGVAVCSYGEKQEFKKSVMLEGIGTVAILILLLLLMFINCY